MDDKIKPDETGYRFIGKPLPRKEDERLITGRGRFTDDFNVDGQTYAVMVRSPHPHARIVAINSERAKAMPGVLGVFTGVDCEADKIGPIPHDPVPKTKFDMKLTGPGGGPVFAGPHALLPADKVRHVGEAVVMVVAETKAQAMDAAEAVEVQYEELPFVLHTEDAMKPGAPTLWDEVPNNITVETFFGDSEATDRAFARAAHVVKKKFHIGRVTGVPMEPRSALAQYDAATDSYLLYAGSGGAVRQQNELIKVVGVPPERLRVISADVGGNFGTRNRTYVEFGLVLWAAKKLGRPVKFTAMRSEAFLSDYQGRDLVTSVPLRIAVATEQGLRPDFRFVCHSRRKPAFGRGVHQYDADQCVSQLRPAGSHVRNRAIGRRGGAAARRRSPCASPQEYGLAEGDAVPQFGRHALRQRPL
jgi:carbon-monoxide dehydrogenase large subunit